MAMTARSRLTLCGCNGFSLEGAVIYGDDGEESNDFVRM